MVNDENADDMRIRILADKCNKLMKITTVNICMVKDKNKQITSIEILKRTRDHLDLIIKNYSDKQNLIYLSDKDYKVKP